MEGTPTKKVIRIRKSDGMIVDADNKSTGKKAPLKAIIKKTEVKKEAAPKAKLTVEEKKKQATEKVIKENKESINEAKKKVKRSKKATQRYRATNQVDYLTNNKTANMVIIGIIFSVFLVVCYLFPNILNQYLKGDENFTLKVFKHVGLFLTTYIFSSYFFSPDVDLRRNIPGVGRFPFKFVFECFYNLGQKAKPMIPVLYLLTSILTPVHYIINFFWRMMWKPIGYCFTHRGMIHAPFIGSQIIILYVFFLYYIIGCVVEFFYPTLFLPFVDGNLIVSLLGKNGFILGIFKNSLLFTVWLAKVVSDLFHIFVDFYDSWKKGSSFFLPDVVAQHGLFHKIFTKIFGLTPVKFMRKIGITL